MVVRLYLPIETIPQQHSVDQIKSARLNGCTVGGYVWCYSDADPHETMRDAAGLARSVGLELPILWLDLETYAGRDGPSVEWVRTAVEECRSLGVRVGIYTGAWYMYAAMGNTTALSDLPLWAAQYDGIADVDAVVPFAGWSVAAGKQYSGDSPVDLDVFRSEFTVPA